MGLRTFPGVYTTVRDQSFFVDTRSRFRCGLIGPAERGPLNQATPVRSLRDFRAKFGRPLTGSYLAQAVQLIGDISDGITVVRIARQYEVLAGSGASATGTAAGVTVNTPNVAYFQVGDYVRVSQPGKWSTVNARVAAVGGASITISGTTLKDTYTAANVDRSRVNALDGDPTLSNNAANEAETLLKAAVWQTTPIGGGTPVTVSGVKSSFEVTVESGDESDVAVGDLVLIKETGSGSASVPRTREIMVREVVPAVPGVKAVIKFEPVSRPDIGYTALPLQSNYEAAELFKLETPTSYEVGFHLLAANPGTWANSDGVRTGLIVKVIPGTTADTKRVQVYENSTLVEEIDNLTHNATTLNSEGATVDHPYYFPRRINATSAYIRVVYATAGDELSAWLGAGDDAIPANTLDGWQVGATKVNVGAFVYGYNGENVLSKDYIGTVDPVTELSSGLKVFEDLDANLRLDVIAAPGVTSVDVALEMDRINKMVHAVAILDSPRGLNARQATDWHNGVGPYSTNGKLDTYTVAIPWGWFLMSDSVTGNRVWVPPSLGMLRAMAYTFDAEKPWIAAAGETRGLIPEALQLEFPRVSVDAKHGMYGDGNCLNPIILNRQRIMIYGNRTTQRVESKLTAINNVFLVNTVLRGMSEIGRRYIFDPIDDILYAQLYQDFSNFLDGVQNDRGLEKYELVVDKTNNTAADRNARSVIVDVILVPVDALERLFINATVRESGAVLNSAR